MMTVKFYLKTSKMGYFEEYKRVSRDIENDELLDLLLWWCVCIYPSFYITESRLQYGVLFNDESLISENN